MDWRGRLLCRFLDAGNKEAPQAQLTGVQKPTQGTKSREVEHRLSSVRYEDLTPAPLSMVSATDG
jgi:hypothetical protein